MLYFNIKQQTINSIVYKPLNFMYEKKKIDFVKKIII
jgi:hypothetical protein